MLFPVTPFTLRNHLRGNFVKGKGTQKTTKKQNKTKQKKKNNEKKISFE